MTELTSLTINVTAEQRQRLEYLAKTYNYESAETYALSIIEQVLEEPTKEEILEGIRISLREALNGETIPASELHRLLTEDDE
ncbi:MAG: hypothetical protein H0X30_10140 [Anaerolineae bacterium]|nr:hypothetical protein [Anaerolineae bacterium]